MKPNKDSIDFGNKLRELRAKKDMSQANVAELLGIGQTTYAGYENGKRNATVSTINMFSKFYNVNPNYLLGMEKHVESVPVSPPHYTDLTTDNRKVVDSVSQTLYEQQGK